VIQEIVHILTDPSHIVSEFVWELTFLLLSVIIARWGIRREHRRLDAEHGFEHDENRPIPYTLTDKGLRA
jgi:hypothetical protein